MITELGSRLRPCITLFTDSFADCITVSSISRYSKAGNHMGVLLTSTFVGTGDCLIESDTRLHVMRSEGQLRRMKVLPEVPA